MEQIKRLPKNHPSNTIFRRIVGLLAAFYFFTSLIVVNFVQMLSMVLLLFSRTAFRKFNANCGWFWWGMTVWATRRFYGVQVTLTGDTLPDKENVILIANHQGMTDIQVLFFLGLAKQRLGDMKFFAKDVLKWIPGLGWGAWFLDFIFLKRNWEADAAYIDQSFRKFKECNIPVWLLSFLEGTRITDAKLAQSQEYARKNHLPEPKCVLVPRTKGFVASVRGLRTHLDAVYDVTIGYPEGIPSLWQWTKGLVPKIHLHTRRFSMAEMPEDPSQLAQWVRQRFVEKDLLMQEFGKLGHFPSRA